MQKSCCAISLHVNRPRSGRKNGGRQPRQKNTWVCVCVFLPNVEMFLFVSFVPPESNLALDGLL